MKILANIYVIFFFLLFGPEAIAKSLPMKRVQTVETVWVPMEEADMETVIEEKGEIKSVEIPEGSQEAVPLFKEAVSEPPPAREEEMQVVQSEELPDLQIKAPKAKEGQQPPVIQVIYQGYEPKKEQKEKVEESPKIVEREKVTPPVDPEALKEQVKKLIEKKGKKKSKEGGDIYNFYFRS